MKVEELLDQIDDMVDKAMSIPLTGGKCLIDPDKLRDILDGIRANLPVEVRQAKAIVADRSEIIADAKKQAEDIVRKSEERARVLIAQEEITKQAQQQASEMLNQAQQKAREMRKGAMEFSEDLLRRSEEVLVANVSEIRKVRTSIRAPKTPVEE
ncbi:MAG: ATPase [Clostridia bacterium]|nr:ATPase [Clostridia bacterium]